DVKQPLILRADPQAAVTIAQERRRFDLPIGRLRQRIRVQGAVDDPLDRAVERDENRAVLVLGHPVDFRERIGHRIGHALAAAPSPETAGRADPEIAVRIFVEADDEAAERAVLSFAAYALVLNGAELRRSGDARARPNPDRALAIGEQRR